MTPRRLIRLLVLADLVTGLVSIPLALLHPSTDAAVGPVPWIGEVILSTIWGLGWMVSLIALWRFVPWGPAVYAGTTVVGVIASGLEASSQSLPGDGALVAVQWLITGITIGVTQFSSAASLFAKKAVA